MKGTFAIGVICIITEIDHTRLCWIVTHRHSGKAVAAKEHKARNRYISGQFYLFDGGAAGESPRATGVFGIMTEVDHVRLC